jgi:hypothetical protein
MQPIGSRLARLVVVAVALFTAACETLKLPDYQRFAEAGIVYGESVPAALDSAFTEAVRADSAVLRSVREQVPEAGIRAQRLAQNTALLRERRAQLDALGEHARQLHAYFVELQLLASSDGDAAVAARTRSIVDRLTALRPEIADLRIGRRSVGEVASGVGALAVSAMRARALEAELRRNGAVIRDAIALQRAALDLLAEQTRENARLSQGAEERDRVTLPFARGGDLPRDWDWQRLQALRPRPGLDAVVAAEAAARSLDAAFAAVALDRLQDPSIDQLVRDVRRLQALVERGFRR